MGARTILITGGTSGIGAGIASAFAAQGDRVTVTGATGPEVELAREQLAVNAAHVLDVRDGVAVCNLLEALGELDVVVNCAGIIRRGAELDPDVFAQTIDVNLKGTMRVCAAARKGLKARSGCIINTASIMGLSGGGLYPNISYQSSKGAVVNLTRSLAVEWAREGIRVNAIAPTWVRTDFIESLTAQPGLMARIEAMTPMGRIAEVDEIVGGVIYLASPAAGMVTGHTLAIDGGFLAQ